MQSSPRLNFLQIVSCKGYVHFNLSLLTHQWLSEKFRITIVHVSFRSIFFPVILTLWLSDLTLCYIRKCINKKKPVGATTEERAFLLPPYLLFPLRSNLLVDYRVPFFRPSSYDSGHPRLLWNNRFQQPLSASGGRSLQLVVSRFSFRKLEYRRNCGAQYRCMRWSCF